MIFRGNGVVVDYEFMHMVALLKHPSVRVGERQHTLDLCMHYVHVVDRVLCDLFDVVEMLIFDILVLDSKLGCRGFKGADNSKGADDSIPGQPLTSYRG